MTPSDRDTTGLLTRPDPFVQLISPTGERHASAEFDPWIRDIDVAALGRLYRDMTIVRRLDAEGVALQRQGELGLWPPLAGQEAAQVGSERALQPDDFVFSSYREMGVAWCRGVEPAALVVEWRGAAASGWNPYDHGMAVPQIIIGAQALHATGYAMGLTWDRSDAAAIAYFGDGATSEGDVNEALVFAASFNAPVVFFCQNNGWAIWSPSGSSRSRRSRAAPTVSACRASASTQRRARGARRDAAGPRPRASRRGADVHRGRDLPHGAAHYRRRSHPVPLRAGARRVACPRPAHPGARIPRCIGGRFEGLEREVAGEADRAAAELRAACIGIPDPEPMSVFDHVYAEPNTHLERQRDHYVGERSRS